MSSCIIDETTGGRLMKIGEVSDLTNISMRSLRYHEENNINNYLVLLEIC